MSTLTVYPHAASGSIIRNVTGTPESFATLRVGAGTATGPGDGLPSILDASTTSNLFDYMQRGIYSFDTSALTAGAIITSATISFYGEGKFNGLGSDDLHVVASTPANYAALVAADFSQTGSTSFGSVTYANYSITGYNDIVLNASGLTNISKTGISKFGLRGGWDLNNSFTGAWASGSASYHQFSYDGSNDPKLVIQYYLPLTNPANAYVDDGSFATATSADGIITVDLSKDGGATYQSALSKTFSTSETLETYGAGSTELWGTTWTGDDVDDTSFRLRVTIGAAGNNKQVYKTFGFAPSSSVQLTGIEVSISAKWTGGTTSIDLIQAKIYYGTSLLPVTAGSQAFATDGRKNGEGAGAGTGVLVFHDGTSWIACDSGAAVAA